MRRRKVRTTDEAMALFEAYNATLLHNLRVGARVVYERDGKWDTQKVSRELEREGIYAPTVPNEAERRIHGCIALATDAHGRVWEKTGEKASRARADRNVHAGAEPVCVWTKRDGADLSEWREYLPMPPRPPAPVGHPVPPLDELKHYMRLATLQGSTPSPAMAAYVAWREGR